MSRVPQILVVDDEPPIRKLVSSYLEAEGWRVLVAVDGSEAIDLVRAHQPDLVILDILMPGIDGIEALRRIRTFSQAYVILLTARAEETDKLIGLAVGADDYISKPFSPRELVARIKAVLRRSRDQGPEPGGDTTFMGDGLVIDTLTRAVTVDDVAVELTSLDFDLLASLAEQPGRVFSRRQLLERVWGWDYYSDERVVDVHIRNLRKALGDDAGDPRWVGTVRGVGYRFVDSER